METWVDRITVGAEDDALVLRCSRCRRERPFEPGEEHKPDELRYVAKAHRCNSPSFAWMSPQERKDASARKGTDAAPA